MSERKDDVPGFDSRRLHQENSQMGAEGDERGQSVAIYPATVVLESEPSVPPSCWLNCTPHPLVVHPEASTFQLDVAGARRLHAELGVWLQLADLPRAFPVTVLLEGERVVVRNAEEWAGLPPGTAVGPYLQYDGGGAVAWGGTITSVGEAVSMPAECQHRDVECDVACGDEFAPYRCRSCFAPVFPPVPR